ncbi:MAG: RtcB family protein [Vulcanimicrobiota bacterium]
MYKWRSILERIDEYRWRLPKTYKQCMNTDGIIFADNQLMDIIDQEQAVEQVANVACLPGITGPSLAMPDIHWGYGFPVGGVAAFDTKTGVISPGGIGYDINCGVRLLRTGLTREDVKNRIDTIILSLFSSIPCGVGKGGSASISKKDLEKILRRGSQWAVAQGMGEQKDLEFTESKGFLEKADIDAVSSQALKRGIGQLGTLGSGNHFLEIQAVQEIFDEEAARAFGIEKGMVTVMIHTGSRGLGHQVASDYISSLGKARIKYGIEVPDRQLSCVPIKSEEGREYLSAMAAAANFAWCNRQIIVHKVREVFEKIFKTSYSRLGMEQIYDVTHNIAKFEKYVIDGKEKTLCVHRKGATRSFGPGSSEIPRAHREVGQAVIIPGDMGRYSYLLAGANNSKDLSFSSTCHGAGRVMSRGAAKRSLKGRDIAGELEKKGIYVKGVSWSSLAEEAPDAYKDIANVVNTAHGAGLARKVAKLKPLGVMKG